jgi:hypothetical protein
MAEIKIGQRWRHKKRGSVYEIVDISATIQCSARPEIEKLFELQGWVVYRSMNGRLVVRPYPEFMDGRFELVRDVTKF